MVRPVSNLLKEMRRFRKTTKGTGSQENRAAAPSHAAGASPEHEIHSSMLTATKNGAGKFDGSIEALIYALHEGAIDGLPMEIHSSMKYTESGLKHCSVQVTQGSGGFGIDAYDVEADELQEMAKKYLMKMRNALRLPESWRQLIRTPDSS